MTKHVPFHTMQAGRKKEARSVKGIVSRDKMSGKNRRALDRMKRNVWDKNPATRIRESGKLYNRRRMKTVNEAD